VQDRMEAFRRNDTQKQTVRFPKGPLLLSSPICSELRLCLYRRFLKSPCTPRASEKKWLGAGPSLPDTIITEGCPSLSESAGFDGNNVLMDHRFPAGPPAASRR
jgi:hypothetical protein